MIKYKCEFTPVDVLRVLECLEDNIQILQRKKPHELSEVIVYRLFILISLEKKFRSKSRLMHPDERFKFSFELNQVLALKNILINRLSTPGLSDIFMKLDKYIHPAIQLEI